MKRRIWNSIGMTVLAVAIAFSLAQLRTPVVKADGCPDASTMGYGCTYLYGLWWMENGVEHGECHYVCECWGCWAQPDINNFLIEQTYYY